MANNNRSAERQAQQDMKPDQQDNGEQASAGQQDAAAQGGEDGGQEGGYAQLPEADTEALVRELQETQARAEQNWEQVLRIRAEMENLQRRCEKDVENAHKYALEKFLIEFLPVHDSLELGLSAAQDDGADVAKLREGQELTLNLVRSLYEKFNIKEINPVQEKFNPELHQAMSTQESTEVEPNTVVMVYQKGYMLNDRLLRPALVVVSASPSQKSGEQGNIDESA